jgi:hypothetical protein
MTGALPVTAPLPQSPELGIELEPGRVIGLVGAAGSGLTRMGLAMLASPSRLTPVVALDVRGWLNPSAAWEVGVDPGHLVVVRCPDRRTWVKVLAALLEGVRAVYAEVPGGTGEHDLRRLAALARARRAALVLRPVRGDLPTGVSHLLVRAVEVVWEGAEGGHGRLLRRRLTLQASGRGMAGMDRILQIEDGGSVFEPVGEPARSIAG